MKTTNNKEQLIYEYIIDFTKDNGYAPTIREIGAHFNIASTSNVVYYLEKLKKQGKINSEQSKYRSLTVNNTNNTKESIAVPLVGRVSAGTGLLAEENLEGYYLLPRELYNNEEQFLLQVEGDSMCEIGICNGDYVVVTKQSTANIEDIVVVFWQDKATVKRLTCLVPFTLHPENSTMQDIILTENDQPIILGKVVGCLKRF